MGVQDRKWYADATREREAKEEAKAIKRAQQTQQPQQPSKPQAHWTLMLMLWVALLIIGTAIARHFR